MDSCQRFKEMLSDYIEGSLDQQNKRAMEQHLRNCLQCTQKVRQLKSLIHNLQALPKVQVSPDFETILRARISMERRRKRQFIPALPFPLPAHALSAIIIILALVGSYFLLKPNQAPIPQAKVDTQWYNKNGPVKYDPSTHEKYIYFIERQPVQYVNPQPRVQIKNDVRVGAKTLRDSTELQRNRQQWMEVAKTYETTVF